MPRSATRTEEHTMPKSSSRSAAQAGAHSAGREPYVSEFGYYQSSLELERGLEVSVQRLSELPPTLIELLLAVQRAARAVVAAAVPPRR
jgi:hypothetical protein